MKAETRYASNGSVSLAYQVHGNGPHDLLFIPDWLSHLEMITELPDLAHFMERLTGFARVIMTDMRGTGASDPVPDAETRREDWIGDVAAVMAAANCPRPILLGMGHGAQIAMLFAAARPEATEALILMNAYARLARADDYRPGLPPALQETTVATIARHFGDGSIIRLLAPSLADAPGALDWWARVERIQGSPARAVAKQRAIFALDVRDVLPEIEAPTLIVHSRDHLLYRPDHARYLAEHIAHTRYCELPGADHWPLGDTLYAEVEEFVTGMRPAPEPDRVLATVLFTDLVGSTVRAATLGDHGWRRLLDAHDRIQRETVAAHRGRIVDWAGDGVFATFDGPARAIRCAAAVRAALRPLGLELRAGVHAGEVEVDGDRLRGITVHVGARVGAAAAGGETLVSSTVRELAAGSGFRFEDRGVITLKGVPDAMRLFAVTV